METYRKLSRCFDARSHLLRVKESITNLALDLFIRYGDGQHLPRYTLFFEDQFNPKWNNEYPREPENYPVRTIGQIDDAQHKRNRTDHLLKPAISTLLKLRNIIAESEPILLTNFSHFSYD